jgi:hypothetical protein
MSASLVLHVRDPAYVPASMADLEQVLLQVGLIGKAWGDGAQHRYLIGGHFLQLVTFLGCAPAIELEPPANGDAEFCHVGISEISPVSRFMADSQGVLSRCPHCRKRYEDWQSAIQYWHTDSAYQTQCPACRKSLSPMELDWCQSAGFGHFFISIFNIYPREAIPTEALLLALRKATNQTWDYFYTRESG